MSRLLFGFILAIILTPRVALAQFPCAGGVCAPQALPPVIVNNGTPCQMPVQPVFVVPGSGWGCWQGQLPCGYSAWGALTHGYGGWGRMVAEGCPPPCYKQMTPPVVARPPAKAPAEKPPVPPPPPPGM